MIQDNTTASRETPSTAGVPETNADGSAKMVTKGKAITDARYILYVDDEVKAFESIDDIPCPVQGSSTNHTRTEYVMPYTFTSLKVGQNKLCALIPHVGLGLGIYFVLAIVSFLMMALGKRRMNIHERITRTIVVDKKRSIIFDSLHDKSLYMEKHNLDERGNPLVKVSLVEGEPNVNLTKEE